MGRMRLKGQVGRGVYRVGKPMGTVGIVFKSIVRPVLLGCTTAYYSSSRVCPVVFRHMSAWFPICTICRVCPVLLGVRPVKDL
jgi:hypothetical protein